MTTEFVTKMLGTVRHILSDQKLVSFSSSALGPSFSFSSIFYPTVRLSCPSTASDLSQCTKSNSWSSLQPAALTIRSRAALSLFLVPQAPEPVTAFPSADDAPLSAPY